MSKKTRIDSAVEKNHIDYVDEWFAESSKLIGQERGENLPGTIEVADLRAIQWFSWALGDDNPLYTDPAYAARTRYGCLIAAPTILGSARYTISHGARVAAALHTRNLFSGTGFEWFDVIRIGTRFITSMVLTDTFTKKGSKGKLYFMITESNYWDHHEDLLGKAHGTMIIVPPAPGKDLDDPFYDREMHRYSDDEVKRIADAIMNSFVRQGSKPRYWEDVNVGDTLNPKVKGPMKLGDMINFEKINGTPHGWELEHRSLVTTGKEHGAHVRYNPITNWPYNLGHWEHEDMMICKWRGMKAPFDIGFMRVLMGYHVITDWMGDDGFLRKLSYQIRRPYYMGDTLWYKAEVVKKYKVTEKGAAGPGGVAGEAEYNAVDIRIDGVNQVGEPSTPGTATVYLPSRGHEVTLPIPHMPTPIPESARRVYGWG